MVAIYSRAMAIPRPLLAAAPLALLACSGASGGGSGGPQGPIEEAPEPKTEAVLVGPLCEGDHCQCKQGETDAGTPEGDAKRFEVKLGPSDDPLWATVDGMVLYKSREQADACFYVDLATGDHKVTVRGKGEGGLSVGATISEMGGGQGATWWYNTFDFNCGAPGECDLEQVKAFKDRVSQLKGKHDPCGSTKVKEIEWETGRMPDRAHPDDLVLRATLQVYKFVPKSPPGSSDCDKSGEGEGAEEGAPAAP
jgi:hypothetical protein